MNASGEHEDINVHSIISGKLKEYEPVPQAKETSDEAHADYIKTYVMAVPPNFNLEQLNNVNISLDAINNIKVSPSNSGQKQISYAIDCKQNLLPQQKSSLHVLRQQTGSYSKNVEVFVPFGFIKVTELNTPGIPDANNCIKRPAPPSMPGGLKHRLTLFGSKPPEALSPNMNLNNGVMGTNKNMKQKKKKRKLKKQDSNTPTNEDLVVDQPTKKKKKHKRTIHLPE
ncbi:unnamed protein product [Clavelina lepadiformis]|uniref:Uncharacterized protein n=1 Tax=Clavelina lepadiformis TaxID=159417 RepID=A0ABP0FLF4_CLALP